MSIPKDQFLPVYNDPALTIKEIAAKFNIVPSYVCMIAKKLRLEGAELITRKKGRPRKKVQAV